MGPISNQPRLELSHACVSLLLACMHRRAMHSKLKCCRTFLVQRIGVSPLTYLIVQLSSTSNGHPTLCAFIAFIAIVYNSLSERALHAQYMASFKGALHAVIVHRSRRIRTSFMASEFYHISPHALTCLLFTISGQGKVKVLLTMHTGRAYRPMVRAARQNDAKCCLYDASVWVLPT